MTVNIIMQVLKEGDEKGSALKELAFYYGCHDFDLSMITDQMAKIWLIEERGIPDDYWND